MSTTQDLIYNELILIRKDFALYMEKMDSRVSSLEKFRDKMVGVFIAVGVGIRYLWDYFKERIV
jgi:hypothetical protein